MTRVGSGSDFIHSDPDPENQFGSRSAVLIKSTMSLKKKVGRPPVSFQVLDLSLIESYCTSSRYHTVGVTVLNRLSCVFNFTVKHVIKRYW